jgi:hypothetical protein
MENIFLEHSTPKEIAEEILHHAIGSCATSWEMVHSKWLLGTTNVQALRLVCVTFLNILNEQFFYNHLLLTMPAGTD